MPTMSSHPIATIIKYSAGKHVDLKNEDKEYDEEDLVSMAYEPIVQKVSFRTFRTFRTPKILGRSATGQTFRVPHSTDDTPEAPSCDGSEEPIIKKRF